MSSETKSHTLSENCGALFVLAFLVTVVVMPIWSVMVGLRHDKGLRQDEVTVTVPSHRQKRFTTLPIKVVEEYTWQDDPGESTR